MTRRRFISLLLIAALALPGTAAAEPTPGEAAKDFHQAYRALGFSGLPDRAQLQALSPHLSRRLVAQLEEAQLQQEAFVAEHAEKPPHLAGDLFSSLAQGATALDPAGVRESGSTARVLVRMRRADLDPPPQWTDRYTLVRERGRWVLDDVEYRGELPGARRGTLSSRLSAPM